MEAVSTTPGESFLLKFRLCLGKFRKINRIFVFQKNFCSKLFYDKAECNFDNPAQKFHFKIQKLFGQSNTKNEKKNFWCFERIGVFFRGKMLDS